MEEGRIGPSDTERSLTLLLLLMIIFRNFMLVFVFSEKLMWHVVVL